MLFTLDAVFAREGDALILHYGPPNDPSWILIDGGARGAYRNFLRPRFQQIRELYGFAEDEGFPLEMMMVSHIDADHITGILDLVREMDQAVRQQKPVPYAIKTLWHNSFDDILGNQGDEIVSRIAEAAAAGVGNALTPLPTMAEETQAVVASTKQGRELRNLADKLDIRVNDPFEGLVMAPDGSKAVVPLGHGLQLTVLGPLRHRVEEFQAQWDRDLEEILADEKTEAEAAAFSDDSPFNLASLTVVAELDGKSMLLTGDARGDDLIDGLVEAGLLPDKEGSLHVDLFKLPHHGSNRNVTGTFFRQITADHYVVSGNGRHSNPDPETLRFLAAARGDDPYTLHLTFEERAFQNVSSESRKEALKAIHDWLTNERPPNCTVVYRDDSEDAFSVAVDLGEPLVPEGG